MNLELVSAAWNQEPCLKQFPIVKFLCELPKPCIEVATLFRIFNKLYSCGT